MEPTKVCVKCKERRPMTRYPKNERMNGGYEHVCKDCKAAKVRERRKENKVAKHCYRCKEYKPVEEYAVSEATRDGLATICNTCTVSLKDITLRVRMKVCTECKRQQSFAAFSKSKRMLDGHESVCKNCRSVREKKRRAERNPALLEQESLRKERDRLRYRGQDPFKLMRNAASTRAKKAGVPFDITADDLYQMWEDCAGRCPVSGQKMTLKVSAGQSNRSPFKASLDRIVPEEGYTLENSRLVCWQVNCMKAQLPDEELIRWCRYIVEENVRAEKEITSLLKKFK